MADTAAVDAAFDRVTERWGSIDILVNNAAVASVASIADRPIADVRREFEVNFFGYLRTIRRVLPDMRARNAGFIHNMGSGVGVLGHPGLAGYAATKGAIGALTRSLRFELRHTDVSCSLMVPPSTNTRLTAQFDYPAWMTVEPDAVGRKLAGKVESSRPVITPDWQTSLGLTVVRWVPALWEWLMAQAVDDVASDG